jgi:transcription antitermination factor NusG
MCSLGRLAVSSSCLEERFHQGDRVRITGDSFARIEGVVAQDQQIPEWVRVAFKVYGREVQTEVEAQHVQKLE